jgi:L-threonylcarbamoyladenylate synthase
MDANRAGGCAVKTSVPRILRVADDPAAAVEQAAAALGRGSLVVLPTDTVYGVSADPRLAGAEDRLRRAKGRDEDKPIPLLASDAEGVTAAGFAMDEAQRLLAARFWPGPLTLVLRAGSRSEGIRVPACETARAVIRACGGLLRVTSANRSGEPPALTAAAAAAALAPSVALVLDDGPTPGGVPSSVVAVVDGRIRVLREGAVSAAEIERTARGAIPCLSA